MIASEMRPFGKVGGLGDVMSSLPPALASLPEVDGVYVFVPYYSKVYDGPKEEVMRYTVKLGMREFTINLYKTDWKGVSVYLIGNEELFGRSGIYLDEEGRVYEDEHIRFAVFSMASITAIERLNLKPDVIHVHDWHASFVPVYIKNEITAENYSPETFRDTGLMLTIHNIAYQGVFPYEYMHELNLPDVLFNMEALEFYGKINILKGGIVYSDSVTTVSPTYAEEIKSSPEYGMGLEGILSKMGDKVKGILNGIDYDYWNPAKDEELYKNYSKRNVFKGKAENKANLQAELGLPQNPKVMMMGIVARLDRQKGFDLIDEAVRELVNELEFQLVVLGTGNPEIQERLVKLAQDYPDRVKVKIAFDPVLAKRIYAGSDVFLMPSRFEPCGLGQMISYRYGTLVIARATGGLKDTVTDYSQDPENATGFLFDEPTAQALASAMRRAVELYSKEKIWRKLVRNVLEREYTWERSAKHYLELYGNLRSQPVTT